MKKERVYWNVYYIVYDVMKTYEEGNGENEDNEINNKMKK